MGKSNKEIEFYRILRSKMIVRAEMLKVNWARYYANLLDLGGVNNEQYLKNYFNDDMKKFNSEQLATILLDLEEHKNIEPICQTEVRIETLKAVMEIGNLTSEMEKVFDNNDDVSKDEATKLIVKTTKLISVVKKLHLRLIETKAKG